MTLRSFVGRILRGLIWRSAWRAAMRRVRRRRTGESTGTRVAGDGTSEAVLGRRRAEGFETHRQD